MVELLWYVHPPKNLQATRGFIVAGMDVGVCDPSCGVASRMVTSVCTVGKAGSGRELAMLTNIVTQRPNRDKVMVPNLGSRDTPPCMYTDAFVTASFDTAFAIASYVPPLDTALSEFCVGALSNPN